MITLCLLDAWWWARMTRIRIEFSTLLWTLLKVWCPYSVCLLIWVAKLEMSHVLQSNKNKTFRGCCDRLSPGVHCQSTLLTFPNNFRYQEVGGVPTGKCGVLITGVSRTIVTKPGASKQFTLEFIQRPENWSEVRIKTLFHIWVIVQILTNSGRDVRK